MAGQSSQLTLKEAKAMQERIQASGSHAKSQGNSGGDTHRKKTMKEKEC